MDPLVTTSDMKTTFLLALTFLSGCGQVTNECMTPYNMNVLPQTKGEYVPYTCAEFAEIEARIFEVFPATVKDPRFRYDDLRVRVSGLRIEVNPNRTWDRPAFEEGKWIKETVGGEAFCPNKMIRINTDSDLWQSSLAHELAHWVQDCSPRRPLATTGLYAEQHSNWFEDGIYDSIDIIYAESPEFKK